MIRHVVMFQWSDEATDEVKEAAMAGLTALPDQVESVRSFSFGPDAGLSEGNFDVVVVADFDDADGYRAYATHPDHLALVADRLRPYLRSRAAVQYERD